MIKSNKGADSTKRERVFHVRRKGQNEPKKHQDDDEGVAVGMKRAVVLFCGCVAYYYYLAVERE
jgi:hypothetical protein